MKSFAIASLLSSLASAAALPGRRTSSGTTSYTSGSTTASDVDDGVCAPLTVIFARGSLEPGTIGTIVGPPLFDALSSSLGGKVALQGVDYPADLAGNLFGGASGAPAMKKLVAKARQQCPDTKIVLSGYSQGAFVVHYSLNKQGLPSSDVSAIVTFGDPGQAKNSPFGSVPNNDAKQYCASGDLVCEQGVPIILPPHFSYGSEATDAAQFIIKTTSVS